MTTSFYVALRSTGIVDVSFDPSKDVNESLSVNAITSAGEQPGWLAKHQDTIYCVSRNHYPDESGESGGVHLFQKQDQAVGKGLIHLQDRSSNGKGGVHCEVSPDGKILGVANINGATVSIFPVLDGGRIGSPALIIDYNEKEPGLKESPSPHQCRFDPSGKFLFIPLRSADSIYVYSVKGPQQVTQIQKITLPTKSGPRHTICRQLDAARSVLYVICERDNMIRVFILRYDQPSEPGNLSITLKQTVPVLGNPITQLTGHKDIASEILLSFDGQFLYASNRHVPASEHDKISIFSVDKDGGLAYLKSQETLGSFPRAFTLSNDEKNRWVAVAHEITQNIVVFERDPEYGGLKEVRGVLSLGETDPTRTKGPMCILWK